MIAIVVDVVLAAELLAPETVVVKRFKKRRVEAGAQVDKEDMDQ